MRSSPSSGQERPTHREHPGFIGIGRVDTPYCSTGSHGRRTPIGITACLVLVLLLQQVSGSLRGQGPAPFEDTFGGLGHERGFGLARVTQCDTGGYIAVGFTESQRSDDENSATWGDVGIYVARTDAFGARLWERRYEIYGLEAELDEVAYNVIELSNAAEYVVVGSAEYGSENSYVVLMKIDCDGDTLWTRTYDIGINAIGYDVFEAKRGDGSQTRAGDLIVCGLVDLAPQYGGRNGFVMRTDSVGVPIWLSSPTIGAVAQGSGLPATSAEWFNGVIEVQSAPDIGDIVAAGTASDPLPGSGLNQQGYMVRLDPSTGAAAGPNKGVTYYGGPKWEGFEGLCELLRARGSDSGNIVYVGWSGTIPPPVQTWPQLDIYMVMANQAMCDKAQQALVGKLDDTTYWEQAMDVVEVTEPGFFGGSLDTGDVVVTGAAMLPGYGGVPMEMFILPVETNGLTISGTPWVFGDAYGGSLYDNYGDGYGNGNEIEWGEAIVQRDDEGFAMVGFSQGDLERDTAVAEIEDLYLVFTDDSGATPCKSGWYPLDSAVTWSDSCVLPTLYTAVDTMHVYPEIIVNSSHNEVCQGGDRRDRCYFCKRRGTGDGRGMVEVAASQVVTGSRLRPNPAVRGGVVTIDHGSLEGPTVVVDVVDSRGRVVLRRRVRVVAGSDGLTLATADLPAGVYTVIVTDGGRHRGGRLVIRD